MFGNKWKYWCSLFLCGPGPGSQSRCRAMLCYHKRLSSKCLLVSRRPVTVGSEVLGRDAAALVSGLGAISQGAALCFSLGKRYAVCSAKSCEDAALSSLVQRDATHWYTPPLKISPKPLRLQHVNQTRAPHAASAGSKSGRLSVFFRSSAGPISTYQCKPHPVLRAAGLSSGARWIRIIGVFGVSAACTRKQDDSTRQREEKQKTDQEGYVLRASAAAPQSTTSSSSGRGADVWSVAITEWASAVAKQSGLWAEENESGSPHAQWKQEASSVARWTSQTPNRRCPLRLCRWGLHKSLSLAGPCCFKFMQWWVWARLSQVWQRDRKHLGLWSFE